VWCKKCRRETAKDICELCGGKTEREIPLEIYWCADCKVPLIKNADPNDVDRNVCPLCGGHADYLCADLRPVFPEERLLFEIVQGMPLAYIDKSVWASDNRLYIDGKPTAFGNALYDVV
jgi:phosphoadenosine phosphosulfate reductase